jgi:hypothetical protein
MVSKCASIGYSGNALQYCERGGELLTTEKCLGTSKDIFEQMKMNNSSNDRCDKNSFHISIRVAPEDKGLLTNQDWIDISQSYAQKIGFSDNPYAVYIHEESTEREHIHIVASRIQSNNLAVPDNFTHYKSMDFCREMERKYKLREVERVLEKIKNQEKFQRNDKRLKPLENKIAIAIEKSDSIEDFKFHLKNVGVATKVGRGISFIDEGGVKFKGSSINRNYSLKGIEKLLSYEQQVIRSILPKSGHSSKSYSNNNGIKM